MRLLLFLTNQTFNSSFRKVTQLSKRLQSTEYFADLTVIGSGPGGYVAAIRASQLGMSVVCVEKNKTLGGTCLNVGCIPSKSLLTNSYYYYMAKTGSLSRKGVEMTGVKLNLDKIMIKKEEAVADLTKGVDYLFKKNNVTRVSGIGRIINNKQVNVGGTIINTQNILIATGSECVSVPGILIDEKVVVTSTGALSLDKVPNNLVVIGSGVIGVELASVWSRLGSIVTLVDISSNIGGFGIDFSIASTLQNILIDQGVKFMLNTKLIDVNKTNNSVIVKLENKMTSISEMLECDVVLISIGRKPYTKNLGLDALNIETDLKGRIPVNASYQTVVPNIYAIGDCIPGPMLAHKAEDEGIACVDGIAGKSCSVNYECIPSVIYTHPEVAWVGRSEEDLKKENIDYDVTTYPFLANPRAFIGNEIEGYVKVLSCIKTKQIFGTHIIGPSASELINEAVLAQEYNACPEDIARVVHAHPTVGKALREVNTRAYCGTSISY